MSRLLIPRQPLGDFLPLRDGYLCDYRSPGLVIHKATAAGRHVDIWCFILHGFLAPSHERQLLIAIYRVHDKSQYHVHDKRCDLTAIHVRDIPRKMGRRKLWSENVNLTLPEGAKARMDAALEEGEDRLELIREAIERELKRRETIKKRKG